VMTWLLATRTALFLTRFTFWSTLCLDVLLPDRSENYPTPVGVGRRSGLPILCLPMRQDSSNGCETLHGERTVAHYL